MSAHPAWERWDLAARLPEGPPRGRTRFAAAALGAGLLAAVAIPEERLGLGAVLVALAIAGAASLGARRANGPLARLWAAIALLLAATPLLRDATWVVLPALGGAVAFGSLAMAGGRTWAGVARGLAAASARAPWGGLLVARSASTALPAVSSQRVLPVARGAALALVLLTVFGVLFATGDAAFAQLAEDAVPSGFDLGPLPLRVLLFTAAVALAGGLAVARLTGPRDDQAPPARRLGRTEWLIALLSLDLLFAAFVGVQLTVLFGHDDHVVQTAGLTYAEYAREGFAQLMVAAALTLAVVAAARRYGPPGLRLPLVVLCVLTAVVLASALHRLGLYQDAYGATRLRFAAHGTILLTGALLALVLAALAANRFAWLPRASVAAAGLALLAFVAADPDRRIAERNLDRGNTDEAYLRSLSADAAPALPRELATRPGPDGLFGFNLARARAR